MAATVPDATVGSPAAVRVRAFLTFADALRDDTVLDSDQIDRLRQDINAIASFSSEQSRRYDGAARAYSWRQREAVGQRGRRHEEQQHLESELDRIRRESAAADGRSAHDAERVRQAAAVYEAMQAEQAAAAERPREPWSQSWIHTMRAAESMQSPDDAGWRAMEDAGRRLRETQEQARHSAREAEATRARVVSVQARIEERLDQLKGRDESVAGADTTTRTASEAMVIADAAERFCTATYYFLRAREDDEISGRDLAARLGRPIEIGSADRSETVTGRTALERLAALADDPVEVGSDDEW